MAPFGLRKLPLTGRRSHTILHRVSDTRLPAPLGLTVPATAPPNRVAGRALSQELGSTPMPKWDAQPTGNAIDAECQHLQAVAA